MDSGPDGSGALADAGPPDAPPLPDAPAEPSFPNCPDLAAYETSGTSIAISAGFPFRYVPACLEVTAGTTVDIAASTAHPLVRSSAGAPGSPIPVGPSVSGLSIDFDTPGYYPFYCQLHGGETGGMYGVVHVVAGP
jgi:plastocyanin